jgi:hypothetical protein
MNWKRETAYSMISDCGQYKISKSTGWDGARYLCWEKTGQGWKAMDIDYQASMSEAERMIKLSQEAA